MYSARVEADFAAAHFLSHYHGKCENLHGHNYRVLLWVRGESLDEGGMLADFGLLKKALRQVVSELDHSNLNDISEFRGDPSAERIARYIFTSLEKMFGEFSLDPALLWAVDVFETPTSMARYERG
ncbi:6-carboxytetrahydropterin synthase QueD [Breznakiella homolactica]|uniref:6-carboxy-5,6,7,8-tetrahydropterin synthase n=1 Tax=Breznakiella homolactica TaxID=2798577 RepID=A0A7T7XR07_9SPIR|nr:6-carboxytetrahydropterin synthase QueD [Breznakiella homolactica]QQO10902.1 6-carboxytetrahydropterin synthase QueD [Breznakiella homolactica]